MGGGATGPAVVSGPDSERGNERTGEYRPRQGDERQFGTCWLVWHAVSSAVLPPPSGPEPGGWNAHGPQGYTPCLFPFRVFYSAGHPTEAGACSPRAHRRTLPLFHLQERGADVRQRLRVSKQPVRLAGWLGY